MTRDLNPSFKTSICSATGASSMETVEVIQKLWSGYGQILRIRLDNSSTVIAKHIRMES
ncbi:hypothetical protein N9192_00065 [Akkermansiaceae bacterium]|nr:hypothetical protein [Akkermansiaceae bacterium]MDB4541271.1 hypothetical protein [Akkermansiaceae bacterium]